MQKIWPRPQRDAGDQVAEPGRAAQVCQGRGRKKVGAHVSNLPQPWGACEGKDRDPCLFLGHRSLKKGLLVPVHYKQQTLQASKWARSKGRSFQEEQAEKAERNILALQGSEQGPLVFRRKTPAVSHPVQHQEKGNTEFSN